MELFSFRNKVLLGGALLLLSIVLLLVTALFRTPSQPEKPSLPTVSDTYQKAFSAINSKTNMSDLTSIPGFKEKKQINKTTTEYSYTSPLLAQDNIVQTENNKIIYTSQVMVNAAYKNPSLSSYLTKYGTPDEIAVGSKLFGEFAKTYMYPSKGVSFTGNSDTDEVFFVQTFTPTTLTAYKTRYGQDITNDTDHTEPIDKTLEAIRVFKLKLPYFGKNAAITYDGAEDKTTVYIKNGDVGRQEITQLLNDNNISSLSTK